MTQIHSFIREHFLLSYQYFGNQNQQFKSKVTTIWQDSIHVMSTNSTKKVWWSLGFWWWTTMAVYNSAEIHCDLRILNTLTLFKFVLSSPFAELRKPHLTEVNAILCFFQTHQYYGWWHSYIHTLRIWFFYLGKGYLPPIIMNELMIDHHADSKTIEIFDCAVLIY